MVFESSAEEVPPGWEQHAKVVSSGRKIKHKKGPKSFSKKSNLCRNNMKTCEGILQLPEQKQESSSSKNEDSQNVVEDDFPPEWLPRGWMVVPGRPRKNGRSRKHGSSAGSSYKIYVELKTGCKFYSKTQVMKYLESISNSAQEDQKQGGNGDKCFKQDALQDQQPGLGKRITTGENNYQLVEISFEEVSADKHLTQEAAPHIQPLVDNISLTQEAVPNIQPLVDNTGISQKDDNDMIKRSLEVVDRSSMLDGFPPGWVKESRPRKTDHTKTDPYYIDPVSGYEFRSKMDARRFLETGDIRYCKIKPQKSQVKFENDTSAPKTSDCLNMDPIAIDHHGSISRSPTAVLQSANLSEAKKSKERETCSISTDSKSTSVNANEVISEVLKCLALEHGSEANIEGSKLSAKPCDERAVFITSSGDLQDRRAAEDQLDMKTRPASKKSKKRKTLNIPARSSKRLSGQEPEMQPMMLSRGRDPLRAAANGLPHQLDINQQSELPAEPPFSLEVASLETEFQNHTGKPSVCQDASGQADTSSTFKISSVQTEMLSNDEKCLGQDVQEAGVEQVIKKPEKENLGAQDSHVCYPFGDSLSDPCYEFAFKTLTGELPIEETLAFQNLFQQPVEVPCTQTGLSAGLTEIGTTPLFQNGVPHQPEPVHSKLSQVQLPSNSKHKSKERR